MQVCTILLSLDPHGPFEFNVKTSILQKHTSVVPFSHSSTDERPDKPSTERHLQHSPPPLEHPCACITNADTIQYRCYPPAFHSPSAVSAARHPGTRPGRHGDLATWRAERAPPDDDPGDALDVRVAPPHRHNAAHAAYPRAVVYRGRSDAHDAPRRRRQLRGPGLRRRVPRRGCPRLR